MPSPHKMFAKIWLVAMVIAGVVTGVATYETGSSWADLGAALASVGVGMWLLWFLIFALMPWVER